MQQPNQIKNKLENKFIVDISYAHIHTRVFYTILKLNICDLIESGPKSAEQLSKATNVSRDSIIRMCRFFVPHGLFIQEINPSGELDNPIFKKTENSTLFTENGGLKYYGKMMTHDIYYKLSSNLPDLLIHGKNSISSAFGDKDIWDVMKEDEEFQDIFNKTMVEVTSSSDEIAKSIDWSPYKQIVDIGGNHAILLEQIINVCPQVKGINFDLENVLQSPLISKHPSITHVAGNFFESVPSGDCYVIKHILHDWDDDKCIQILKSIHKSIQDGGKIYIFEFLVNPNQYKRIHLTLDLFLLNNYGGKERELFEYQRIANEAGFNIVKSFDLSYDGCLILQKK